MPFNVPTLQELIGRGEQDLASRLGVEVPALRRTNAAVLARDGAAGAFTLVQYQRWISEQIIYDTAEAEILARWADIWGLNRVTAAAAAGDVTVTGTNGTVIPLGTEMQSAAGLEYATTAEATIAAGTATVAVAAAAPGVDGNQDAAEVLTLVSPIAGASSSATVAAGGLAGGADAESDASLRSRLLGRIRQQPHGGASFDYVKWTVETPGITVARRGDNAGDERVWVAPLELGPGTVTVRFMVDDGAGGMAVPDSGEVALVQAYIDSVRPVTAVVTVAAPVAVPLDMTIALTPDTTAVRAAVTAEIADLLLREAEPGGTILISHLREAISIAAGETDHVLSSPAADVTHSTGEIATPGTITWS